MQMTRTDSISEAGRTSLAVRRNGWIVPGRWACVTVAGLAILPAAGCALKEVRGKSAFGPEFRHSGNNGTEEVRYDARQGVEFRWDKGITTGLTYRRRDVDEGSGDNENLFLFEVGYPIWLAPKTEDKLAQRVSELERQLAELRAGPPEQSSNAQPPAEVQVGGN